MAKKKPIKFDFTKFESNIQKALFPIIGLLLIYFAIRNFNKFGLYLYRWDWMVFSGTLTYGILIKLGGSVPNKLKHTVSRLVKRGILVQDKAQDSDPSSDELISKIEKQAIQTAYYSGIAIAVIILVIYILVYGDGLEKLHFLLFTILCVIMGYIAGYYFGWGVYAGFLIRALRKQGYQILAQPGHLDEAAGLKPIGDLYFFQAMLIGITALYFGIWQFIIPFWGYYYLWWSEPYFIFMIIALLGEIFAFLLPLWSFHNEMVKNKHHYLKEADMLGNEIVNLQIELANLTETKSAADLRAQLADKTQRFWAIEKMPTWPIDANIRRRFTVNNAILAMPLALDIASGVFNWETLIDLIKSFIQ